jgi:hypothetical protein
VLALDNGKAVKRIDLSGPYHQGAAIITILFEPSDGQLGYRTSIALQDKIMDED